jgi:Carboxypeptidase regulatory-like domain
MRSGLMPMADSLLPAFPYSQLMCDRDTRCAAMKDNPIRPRRKDERHTRFKPLLGYCCATFAALLFLAVNIGAQETLRASEELPEAPIPQTLTSAPTNQGTASISGIVTDVQGAVILGAAIMLEDAATHVKRTTLSDEQGSFTFALVNEGIFSITIQAKGFAPVVKTGLSLHAGENYQLSPTTMQVAASDSTVQVNAQTQYELAEAQIRAEEKQRFLFIVPNFYVSYVSNPAPLTAGQKMRLAFRSMIDPYQFINTGVNAGWDQWRNNNPGYGQGAAGFAKRYGADYGNVVSGTIVGAGLMPALLHQDPRYFYKGTGSIPSRFGYALLSVVRTKGDNGKWQPNFSGFLGGLAAGAISNSYLPQSDRKAIGNVIGGALQGFALRSIGTLEEEFLARWVTTHARDKGTIGHP